MYKIEVLGILCTENVFTNEVDWLSLARYPTQRREVNEVSLAFNEHVGLVAPVGRHVPPADIADSCFVYIV